MNRNIHRSVCSFLKILFAVLFISLISSCTNYFGELGVFMKEDKANYFVEHWLQNIDGTSYSQSINQTQILTGVALKETTAKALAFEGFTAKEIEQQKIKHDGSTVVKIYYDRKTISYTFKANGGAWGDNTEEKVVSGLYGSQLTVPKAPKLQGYVFSEWDNVIPVLFGPNDDVFSAIWEAGSDTLYTVEHWQQNINDDEYTIVQGDTKYCKGTTGEYTQAVVNSYPGFSAEPMNQALITADGETVVKVFYNRKIINYSFNSGSGKFSNNTTTVNISGRYGAAVVAAEKPSYAGYTFNTWDNNIPLSFGTEDLNFKAVWIANNNTEYKIEHWQQNIENDNYTKVATETKYGVTAEQTAASTKIYTGFEPQTVIQDTIAGDGSTVVKIYYNRKIVSYTFNSSEGEFTDNTSNKTISGRYGAVVVVPDKPLRSGYSFKNWTYAVPSNYGTESMLFLATWTTNGNTAFTIEHWQQNIDDDGYTMIAQDTDAGVTGELTAVSANNYTGFTNKPINQKQITGDGQTIVKVYYDRLTVDYSFNAGLGKFSNNSVSQIITGRFGAAVEVPDNPLRTGYSFNTWDKEIPSHFGTEALTLTASWTANNNTEYKVEHWQQNIENDDYTKVATETNTGTTDELTKASAGNYTGFTSQPLYQQKITGDGSTVIKIYYTRNTVSYSFNAGLGKFSNDSALQTVTGRFGATVNIPDNPARLGYSFNSWNNTIPQKFGTEALTLSAVWTANTNTKYTVEHWQENINDDNYTKIWTEIKYGTTDELTSVTANEYTGFDPQQIVQQTINCNGTAVVKINYKRKIITYTFVANGTIIIKGKYGTNIVSRIPNNNQISSKTLTTGMTAYWNGWPASVPSTLGDEDRTFYPEWYIPAINNTIEIKDKSQQYHSYDSCKEKTVSLPKKLITTPDSQIFNGNNIQINMFAIGINEVTWDIYYNVMLRNEYGLTQKPYNYDYQNNAFAVQNVTWYDAVYFCNCLTEQTMGSMYKVYTIDNVTVTDGHITNADVSMDISQIGFRLPTEAEWELAARGGNPNSGYWGYYYSGGNNKDNVANTSNPLLPIRRKLDNFIGLYDMSGNADEWCWDWYGETLDFTAYTVKGVVVNPLGPETGSKKVCRGGSFVRDNVQTRVGYRYSAAPGTVGYGYGFRLVRTIPERRQ